MHPTLNSCWELILQAIMPLRELGSGHMRLRLQIAFDAIYSIDYAGYIHWINWCILFDISIELIDSIDRVHNAKIRLSRINFNIPHILGPVQNRKSRLGTNFYQFLVVEICQNTWKSCIMWQNTTTSAKPFYFSPYTNSQCSSINFLWFWVICRIFSIFGWNF